MKKNSANITLLGGIISFLSYALPWQNNYTGAHLANSGEATIIITGVLIFACVIFGSCFSILNRETSWNTASKFLLLMISSLVLLIVILLLNSNFTNYTVRVFRLGMNIFILVFVLLLFGIIVYISNRTVFFVVLENSFSTHLWRWFNSILSLYRIIHCRIEYKFHSPKLYRHLNYYWY